MWVRPPSGALYKKNQGVFLIYMYNKSIDLKFDKHLGYFYFWDGEHPLSNKKGLVYYHRHVMSIHLGRWIERHEIVHHKDKDKENNHPSNLVLTTKSGHAKLHHIKKVIQIPCDVCEKIHENKKYCSPSCSEIGRRKVERPSKKELETLILENPYTKIGKMFSVSDNAVRKWAKHYGIL